MLRLEHEEQRFATSATSSSGVAATGYNGFPSFQFVSAPCDVYDRQRALQLAASNMIQTSEVNTSTQTVFVTKLQGC